MPGEGTLAQFWKLRNFSAHVASTFNLVSSIAEQSVPTCAQLISIHLATFRMYEWHKRMHFTIISVRFAGSNEMNAFDKKVCGL